MNLVAHAKSTWCELKASAPGKRFEEHYHRAHARGKGRSVASRILLLGGALVSFAVGIVLVFIPGPAILFFAITGALLATQSLLVARALDNAELKARALLRPVRRWWRYRFDH
jgi:multisubunit Na+/H+ antiporter MnhG subunit